MKSKTPMKSMQRQAIVWGRFSSDQQKDGDSKDRQDRLNHALAKREDIQIIGEHFDEGVSVKDGATEKFKKIISELPSGTGIICENLDRISRGKPWRAKAMLLDIIEAGHFIITSQDGREYNEETIEEIDTLLLGDLSTNLARIENNKRTKRVKEAKSNAVELARQGLPAPLGAWLPAHVKYNFETKQYDIREDRRKVIENIFEDYASGKGVVSITKGLNEDGILTFRGKGKLNGWQRTTVFTLLRFEGVIGVFNYNPSKDKTIIGERIINAWKPAISEKLFYKVQSILEVNKSKHGNYASKRVNNIMRGLCKCSHCGSGMIVTTDGYLACSGYQQGRCKVKNMIRNYKDIEWAFMNWFVDVAKDVLLGKDNRITDIEALISKKNALAGKIEAMVSLLDSASAANAAKARLDKLGMELNTVENEIATAKASQANNATLPEAFEQLQSYVDGVMMNDQDIRKKVSSIVPTIVKRIEIDVADKLFLSFTVFLINGEKIEWEYDFKEFSQPIIGIDKDGHFILGKCKAIDGEYSIKEAKA